MGFSKSTGRPAAQRGTDLVSLYKRGANWAGLENDREISEIRRCQEIGAFAGSRIDLAGGFMDPIQCGIERL